MIMETVMLSKCCNIEVAEQGGFLETVFVCTKCGKECEVEEVCSQCFGTGEISTDERNSDGNWERGVGTEKCHCKITEQEYDNQQ